MVNVLYNETNIESGDCLQIEDIPRFEAGVLGMEIQEITKYWDFVMFAKLEGG